MEAKPLKLGAEHVPFPCSLLELVLDRYAEPPGMGSNPHPMQLDELLQYLKSIDNFNLSPWVAIVGQTEAIGDPATPSREQVAILRWLGKALEIWEKQYPLEGRLAAQVRRLKPLSAALAIMDPRFMQPGTHPLHQLLDNIQARAIGWQSRLDRVGAILEQQVARAVDQSRGWFENHATDLAGICTEFSAAAERDQARAQRMAQRVVETETGRVKTASAKQEAARMINALLEKYPAPEEIGEFVKGPWYTSAQLLLLRLGPDSEQWQEMSTTTETLLDSLQSMEEAPEERRQHIFAVVTQLPKEMRRWLLSLHHDTEAVNEAMGLVERAHLRILRRQALELQHIAPLVVEGEHINAGEERSPNTLKNWQEGQWFSVDSDEGILRVQLALKVAQSQLLLFTNMAGIKVLQLSFAQFSRYLEEGKVKALYSGASFSLCLAHAVGIDSVEILDALVSALAEVEPTAGPSYELEPEPVPALRSRPEPEPEQESDLEPEVKSESQSEPAAAQERSEQEDPQHQLPELAGLNSSTDAPKEDWDLSKQRPVDKKPWSDGGFLIEQAEEIKLRGGYLTQQSTDIGTGANHLAAQEKNSGAVAGYLSKQATDFDASPGPLTEQAPDSHAGQVPDTEHGERLINLPMGAWLGFHDGETPLMARLAVHDPDDGYYIFVNRNGVKMRQVSSQELHKLIDDGLVEILETKSNFRDVVTEVRKNLDQ